MFDHAAEWVMKLLLSLISHPFYAPYGNIDCVQETVTQNRHTSHALPWSIEIMTPICTTFTMKTAKLFNSVIEHTHVWLFSYTEEMRACINARASMLRGNISAKQWNEFCFDRTLRLRYERNRIENTTCVESTLPIRLLITYNIQMNFRFSSCYIDILRSALRCSLLSMYEK